MAKQSKDSPAPSILLFPFLNDRLNHPRAGFILAAFYFVSMLFVGLKYHLVGDYNVETDFFWGYVPEAKRILQGHWYIEDFRGPAYPTLLALVNLPFNDFFRSGIVLSTIAGSAVVLFSYETLKRLFGTDVAFMGTSLVAFNATFVQYSYTAGTDMVFNAFVSGSAFFLFMDEPRRLRSILLASTFAGFAYLTRYNGIFFILAVPVVFFLLHGGNFPKREGMKMVALALGVFFATITPWGIYCWIEKGSFFFNRNYLNIAYEMFAKGKIPWDQYWNVEAKNYAGLTQVIFADPALFIGTVFNNLYEHFASDLNLLLGLPLGVLSVSGMVLSFREKLTQRQVGYVLFGLCYFLVLLLVFYGERFSMFLLPIYSAMALKALTWQRLTRFRFWRTIQGGALTSAALVVFTALGSYSYNKANINSGPQEIPVIAQVFKSHFGDSERGKIVLARKPHVAYYLDMTMESFPYVATWEELESQARAANASYLFYGVMEAGLRPQFQQLLDPAKAPRWLKPVTYTASPPAVLYKIDFPAQP